MMTGMVRIARADTLRLEAPAGLALRTPCQAARQEKHMQIGFNAPTSGVNVPEIATAAMLREPQYEQVAAAAVDARPGVALSQEPDVSAIVARPVLLQQRNL